MAGSISSMGLYCFFELLPLLCFEALVLLLVGADLADERGAELLRIPAMTPRSAERVAVLIPGDAGSRSRAPLGRSTE